MSAMIEGIYLLEPWGTLDIEPVNMKCQI